MSSKPQPLTHARQDPTHVLAPGLFRIQTAKKRSALDVTYRFNASEELRFTGFQALGVDDLRVLQALAAMATAHKTCVGPATVSDTGKELRSNLALNAVASPEDAVAVQCTLYRLLTETGYSESGQNRGRVDKSLFRLANVTIKVTEGKREWTSHLLSYVVDNEGDGRLCVALNPRIASAIMGDRKYVRIDMSEVRALASDYARLLHQRLCAVVDVGTSRAINGNTLVSYVWPEQSEKPAIRRKRLYFVRKALREVAATGGWTVEPSRKSGQVIIGRKGFQRANKPAEKPALCAPEATTTSEPVALAAWRRLKRQRYDNAVDGWALPLAFELRGCKTAAAHSVATRRASSLDCILPGRGDTFRRRSVE